MVSDETVCVSTHLDLFSRAIHDPLFRFWPRLVQEKKAALATSLDELVGFGDELGSKYPGWELGFWGDGVGRIVPGDLSDFWRWIDKLVRNVKDGSV